MDPISQGTLGAAFSQTSAPNSQLFKAAVIGALAGMAPDLDVLIRSEQDPLLFLEYHRQFTHSLFFIPIGGILCGLLLHGAFRKRWGLRLRDTLLWSTVGYATHGLLDGCTSYGTQLLWPFSHHRFSWDLISIVDPLFTLPLLVLVGVGAAKRSKTFTLAGIAWIIVYLLFAYVQHERAVAMGHELAESRQHPVQRLEVKPSFANLFVWKVIYETDGVFHVDAVKPGIFDAQFWPGERIHKLNVSRDFPWLHPDSQQARDIQRFDRFSAGFTAVDPDHPKHIIDIRYSMLPQEVEALWGIELSRTAARDEHVDYYTERTGGREAAGRLWEMLIR